MTIPVAFGWLVVPRSQSRGAIITMLAFLQRLLSPLWSILVHTAALLVLVLLLVLLEVVVVGVVGVALLGIELLAVGILLLPLVGLLIFLGHTKHHTFRRLLPLLVLLILLFTSPASSLLMLRVDSNLIF